MKKGTPKDSDRSSRRLNVYTAGYPFGNKESYLNNEIDVLSEISQNINLIPYSRNGEIQPAYNGLAKIHPEEVMLNKQISFYEFVFLIRILAIEFRHIPQKLFFLRKIRRHYVVVKSGLLLSKWLQRQKLHESAIHYSYWMNEWALALAILKKKGEIESFMFRVNGYDIWDNRHEGGYLPFRYFIYSQTQNVFALSREATSYLKSLNFFPDKIQLAYFGTKDHGLKPCLVKEKFTVLTCSDAIPLKRLDKIAHVLILLNIEVKWIHHGEGETIAKVKSLLQAHSNKVEFVQSFKKDDYYEVIEFMKLSDPDLFINLSSTEGLPVSLLEALSLGIPILANRVGGCEELFDYEVGLLVEKDESVKGIAEKIMAFYNQEIFVLSAAEIKEYWRDNFSADVNYLELAKKLNFI